MKKINSVFGAAGLALLLCQQVQADTVNTISTGTPTNTESLLLNSGQWLAGEFTLSQFETINTLEGYIVSNGDTTQIGNTFTISVYDNSPSGAPWLASEEYFGQAVFNGDGWNGLTGITGLQLSAGTYWVAFEVGSNGDSDSLQAYMPVTTPNPLAAYAWYDGVSTSGYNLVSGSGYDVGVQVAGTVPLPSSLLLFATGIFGFARFGKRKAA
jgi:hypothetical protein